jgi:hypothetical protein
MHEVSDWLTAAGVLAALVSAFVADRAARSASQQSTAAQDALKEVRAQTVIARAAVQEARMQNVIATHARRLEVFRALLAFGGSITAHGKNFKREAIWLLGEQAELAEFYYPSEIATSLDSIVRLAIDIESKSQELRSPNSGLTASEGKALMVSTNAAFDILRDSVERTKKAMRSELRLVSIEA